MLKMTYQWFKYYVFDGKDFEYMEFLGAITGGIVMILLIIGFFCLIGFVLDRLSRA